MAEAACWCVAEMWKYPYFLHSCFSNDFAVLLASSASEAAVAASYTVAAAGETVAAAFEKLLFVQLLVHWLIDDYTSAGSFDCSCLSLT